MPIDHETLAHLRECRQSLPSSLEDSKVIFGFDGVVDRVRKVVETRSGPEDYELMHSMSEFSDRIDESSEIDTSCSIEWQNGGTRAGGHTSHLGRATERLGCKPTLIGTFGNPVHETFLEEYGDVDLISIGEVSTTDAVEFDDGKVLLSDTGDLATLDWQHVHEQVGRNTLASRIDRTQVLGVGYWATVPQLPTVLDGLREDIWPRLRDPPERVILDPADIRRLSDRTLSDGLDTIAALDDIVPVTVSANRAETCRIAALFDDPPERSLDVVARRAREGLDVSKFVAHAATEAVSVSRSEEYRVVIPHAEEPVLTTSAGDHFNAGLVVGELADLDDGPQLIAGSGVAGYFVRNGEPPTYDALRDHLEEYEDLFEQTEIVGQ